MGVVKYGMQDEAKELGYDNSISGLAASTIQQAIDLLQSTKEPANSNILKTENIGVTVQAYNSNLTSINQGLTTTSDTTFRNLSITSLNVNNNLNILSTGEITGSVFDASIAEKAQDAISSAIVNGTQTGVSVVYDDVQNALSLTGIIKSLYVAEVTPSSGTSAITPGATAPLRTAGTEILTQTLTPYSSSSKFIIKGSFTVGGSSNGSTITVAVFRDTTYIGAALARMSTNGDHMTVCFDLLDQPNTTSAVTYSCRVGITGGTWYVNRRSNENTYGGTGSGWSIIEI